MSASLGLPEIVELAPRLIDRVPILLDDVAFELSRSTPAYAAFITEHRGLLIRTVRGGMDELLGAMCSHLDAARHAKSVHGEHPPTLLSGAPITLFEQLGRRQARSGDALAPLLSSYQIGARMAWRHLAEVTLGAGIGGADLAALAEAVFAFVDELCAASSRGFSDEQAQLAAVRDRQRTELVELLLSGRADAEAIRAAAAAVRWRLPATVALVLSEPDDPVLRHAISRMGPEVLTVREPGRIGAILPDPSPQQGVWRSWVNRHVHGARTLVGPTVPVDQLPATVPIIRTAAALRDAGILHGDLLFVEDHLDAIVVHRDPQLLARLRQRTLEPLSELSPASRERLTDTLRAWLRHMGDRTAVAAELTVHPQTVRYRMGQLRALLGSRLDDPAYRAKLTLVLEWGSADTTGEPSTAAN